MSWLYLIVGLVAAQRLAELAYAKRNEIRLRALGWIEHGSRHYPLFVLLHGGWLIALAVLVARETTPNWPLIALFAGLQLGRIWVIASLGRFWTTRIITMPGAALVRGGPYRWLRHPNYLIVIGEIAVLPLAFGAYTIALLFSIANAVLLWHRIKVENLALASRQKPTPGD
jgi:methyltransferase